MIKIDVDVFSSNSKKNTITGFQERNQIEKMVRLPKLVNKTLFRAKELSEQKKTTNSMKKDFACINEKEELNIDGENSMKKTCSYQQNISKKDENLPATQNVQREMKQGKQDDMLDIPKAGEVKNICCIDDNEVEDESISELKERIRSMKRSYLFEQNQLVEKFELEKFELRENHEEEKTRLKKAFEHEKIELLKEIERKDKMLHKLAEVLKEQYEKDYEISKIEFQDELNEKNEKFRELNEVVDSIIKNTEKIIDNNNLIFGNLQEFDNIKACKKRMLVLSEELGKAGKVINNDIERSALLNGSILDCSGKMKEHSKTPLGERKSYDEEECPYEIQHEMTVAYRKQKIELVKLFNTEKEEDRKRLDKEKMQFERQTRTEYESRMTVERKGWQDTIEDLEREIKILKYEREQLDRNYCLGMDEVRTEFEKEKQEIYKKYSKVLSMYEPRSPDSNKT